MFPLCSYMGQLKRHLLSKAAPPPDTPRPLTLGALAANQGHVFCWCNRCSHHALLAATALVLQLGPTVPVPEVGAYLTCSGCACGDVATRPHWEKPGIFGNR